MQFYDISPTISETMAVFPGDKNFTREMVLDITDGTEFTLSNMHTTMHIGAHTDAPVHYHQNGRGIDEQNLDYYLGRCQVVSVAKKTKPYRLLPEDLEGIKITAPRVLFHTDSFPDPNKWTESFCGLSPELVDMLAKQHVILVGIDTPSVDPAEAKQLITHHAIYRHDMAILEGIVLNQVPDGLYTLVALPLKIKGADASPVRAILLPENVIT